jgi:hypothetical protein
VRPFDSGGGIESGRRRFGKGADEDYVANGDTASDSWTDTTKCASISRVLITLEIKITRIKI